MALVINTEVMARVKIAMSKDSTFDSKTFDDLFSLDQSTEESISYRDFVSGAVADQAIDFGGIASPTFIFILFESRGDGVGAIADNVRAKVEVKIGGAAANSTSDFIMLGTQDPTNEDITTDIKFTTLADTDTTFTVVIAGKST